MRRFLAILSLLSLANLTTARLGLACEMASATGRAHAHEAATMQDMASHAGHHADGMDERAVPADEDGGATSGCLMMAQCAVVLAPPAVVSRVGNPVALHDVVPAVLATPRSALIERDVPPPKA